MNLHPRADRPEDGLWSIFHEDLDLFPMIKSYHLFLFWIGFATSISLTGNVPQDFASVAGLFCPGGPTNSLKQIYIASEGQTIYIGLDFNSATTSFYHFLWGTECDGGFSPRYAFGTPDGDPLATPAIYEVSVLYQGTSVQLIYGPILVYSGSNASLVTGTLGREYAIPSFPDLQTFANFTLAVVETNTPQLFGITFWPSQENGIFHFLF